MLYNTIGCYTISGYIIQYQVTVYNIRLCCKISLICYQMGCDKCVPPYIAKNVREPFVKINALELSPDIIACVCYPEPFPSCFGGRTYFTDIYQLSGATNVKSYVENNP